MQAACSREAGAGVLKIRTIALIPALCRVARQGLVFGVPFWEEEHPFFVHEIQEDAMPAHVWQLHIRPGKVQDF